MSEQTSKPAVGFVTLTDNMYFTCSSGLKPAKILATQTVLKTKDKHHYLVSDSTRCQVMGDFFCRWTVVLAAAVAAICVLSAGAALAVLIGAIALGGALCGALMAPMRTWQGFSTLNAYGTKGAYSLTSKCQMTCPIIGGVITYAPGITSQWQAIVYMARNTVWAAVEGYLVGTFMKSGLGAFKGTATVSGATVLTNILFSQTSARAIGILDQIYFEGMLRNGKDFSEIEIGGEEVKAGLLMLEQPLFTIKDKITGENKEPLGWQDFYYATVSLLAYRATYNQATTNTNIPKAIVRHAKQLRNPLKNNGKLFERITLESHFNLKSIYDNPVWRSLWKQAKENKRNTGQDNAFVRYENNMKNGVEMTKKQLRDAFNAVKAEFKKLATDLPDGPIHHNNWKLESYPEHITDSKNLYPTESTTQHLNEIHPQTSEGPHPTRNSVSSVHEKPLYEYDPMPIDDNDLD